MPANPPVSVKHASVAQRMNAVNPSRINGKNTETSLPDKTGRKQGAITLLDQ